MERAPLPPHERSWRHPSEVAAATRQEITAEQPSRSTRAAALLGGTATIVLFGVAVFALTPAAGEGPTATGSTPVRGLSSAALAASTTVPDARTSDARSTDARPSDARPSAPVLAGPTPLGPLVTVVGDAGLAVLPSRTVLALLDDRSTTAALRLGPLIDMVGRSASPPRLPGTIVVTLEDGTAAVAAVVDSGDGDGLAMVRLDHDDIAGVPVADHEPEPSETVIVSGPEPVAIEWPSHETDEVLELPDDADVPDGAAVLDEDGHLVGIYVDEHPVGGRLIPIDDVVAAIATPD